ncbi:alpha-amylase [Mycoplasma sp. Ms02]|nr:alpha-amylase [Mycoplasma sp. Ms02]
MYQLAVYAFADGNNDGIGDFIGLKNNLDYFTDLGIDTLYLSPIHPASSYHGYDVIDYMDVAPEFGGMKAFDEFLIEAHKKGIKVILDMIMNHTSFEHPWFQAALKGDSKYENYYTFFENRTDGDRKYGIDDQDARNIFINIEDKIPTNKNYVATFWKGMPDLKMDNPEVQDEMKKIHKFWSRKGVDGFRYDAFYHIWDSEATRESKDPNNEKINRLFSDIREAVNAELNDGNLRSSNEAFMFGEWWGSVKDGETYFVRNGKNSLSSLIDGQNFKNDTRFWLDTTEEKSIIKQLNSSNISRPWMPFLDNHDVERWINRFRGVLRSGEIYSHTEALNEQEKAYYRVALVSLLSRGGLPILYNGNELLAHGGPKSSNGDISVREAFPWKDDIKKVDFYEKKSGKNEHAKSWGYDNEQSVEEAIKDNQSTYNLVKKVISVRKHFDSVKNQNEKYIVDPEDVFSELPGFATVRKNSDNELLVFIHDYSPKVTKSDFIFKTKPTKIDPLLEINTKIFEGKIETKGFERIGIYKIQI